jgi:hypothetical protein
MVTAEQPITADRTTLVPRPSQFATPFGLFRVRQKSFIAISDI